MGLLRTIEATSTGRRGRARSRRRAGRSTSRPARAGVAARRSRPPTDLGQDIDALQAALADVHHILLRVRGGSRVGRDRRRGRRPGRSPTESGGTASDTRPRRETCSRALDARSQRRSRSSRRRPGRAGSTTSWPGIADLMTLRRPGLAHLYTVGRPQPALRGADR